MSTLTSSQLHVKRSSTRLHAPPGGVSSISFGPGGLGTVEEPAEGDKAAKSADPAAAPPSRMGGYAPSYNSNNNAGYDYASPSSSYQQRSGGTGTPRGYGGSTPAYDYPSSSAGGSMWGHHQQQQQPSASASGRMALTSGGGSQFGSMPASAGRPLSGASACSSRSWGSQPPLTSSKRDQNWERKRRQWLARKNGGGDGSGSYHRPGSTIGMAPPSSSFSPYLPPPPMTAAAPFGGGGNNPWDDGGAPSSPLSKFVHQQSQKQSGGFGGYAADYERIDTAAPSPPPPLTVSGYPRDSYHCYSSSSSSGGYPPSRGGSTSGGGAALSQFAQAPTPMGGYAQPASSFTATPASRGGQPAAAGGGGGGGGAGGGNWPNRNVSSGAVTTATARQPPGGHSNWSPFG